MVDKKIVDYSVYLVTGRELLPPGKDYYESLEQSLKDGHVTVVQLREKRADTIDFIDIAKKSLALCDKYKVPMLINDNLAVVQALPERVGLHIGQEDMPISLARNLLGPNRLIGLSLHNVEQAKSAMLDEGLADYVGIGPVYGTKSKSGIDEDDVIGPRGAREIVEALTSKNQTHRLPCVLIGGINQRTALRSLFGATAYNNKPDGIAVISAIVARKDADVAAAELADIVKRYKKVGAADSRRETVAFSAGSSKLNSATLVKESADLLTFHRSNANGPPLVQTLTSHVSSTLSANVALAFSASPIMSHQEAEADDLGRVTGAVVLNIGTISDEARRGMRAVGAAANRGGKPVVLDPVGVGASAFRKRAVNEILNHTQVTLLKGNSAELSAIAGLTEVQSRGVDSGAGTLRDPEGLVRSLALRERCLVLMTGKIDYLSDGQILVKVHNGHELLGRITGSGCALGVTVAAGMAAACSYSKSQNVDLSDHLGSLMVNSTGKNLFRGALLGLLTMTIASEIAAERQDVKGPGSFIPALLDQLAAIKAEDIIERAKVEVV